MCVLFHILKSIYRCVSTKKSEFSGKGWDYKVSNKTLSWHWPITKAPQTYTAQGCGWDWRSELWRKPGMEGKLGMSSRAVWRGPPYALIDLVHLCWLSSAFTRQLVLELKDTQLYCFSFSITESFMPLLLHNRRTITFIGYTATSKWILLCK